MTFHYTPRFIKDPYIGLLQSPYYNPLYQQQTGGFEHSLSV